MPEDFLKLIHVDEAVRMLLARVYGPVERVEDVDLREADGRVVADDIVSPEDLPGFDRSRMDGYAVKARDTFGAGESLPGYLELTGEVPMGGPAGIEVGRGEAVRISTGGVMPPGADAVVMVENTELEAGTVEVTRPVAPGENVILKDEDVSAGSVLLRAGTVLTPARLGALAGVGIAHLAVRERPVVAIISTGDEIVSPEREPGPGQVRDINSVELAAACRRAGCEPREYGIIADDLRELMDCARAALKECDALLISGGSSAGVRDMTLQVLEGLGDQGALAHGLYLKPGKPTLIAASGSKPIVGLPGNPASALAVFEEVMVPVLMKLKGQAAGPAVRVRRTVEAVIDRSVASSAGRMDLVPVSLRTNGEGMEASPVAGKANLIGTLIRADGQVRLPVGSEGVERGQRVIVELFE